MTPEDYKPILLTISPEEQQFKSARTSGQRPQYPDRQREQHAQHLYTAMLAAIKTEDEYLAGLPNHRTGYYVDIELAKGFEDAVVNIGDNSQGTIRLCNLNTQKSQIEDDSIKTYATMWFSSKGKDGFIQKIEKYRNNDTANGKPKYARQINCIEQISNSELISFWQDAPSELPNTDKQWCEVWLANTEQCFRSDFETILSANRITAKEDFILFTARAVKLVLANRNDLQSLIDQCDFIAEFRKAKTTANFWHSQSNSDQTTWIDNLGDRLNYSSDNNISICILDTGITSNHPLISPFVITQSISSVNPLWGSYDHDGHGTEMAGIAIYGDLAHYMETSEDVHISHKLESIKILPPTRQDSENVELWGLRTRDAVNISIISTPTRTHIFNSAVTAADSEDRGRPSSWSASIDDIVFNQKVLFVQAVGNSNCFLPYPATQDATSVSDPAQAWNAIAVGAFTQLTRIIDPAYKDYLPIAKTNELSPFSTTSLTWHDQWPIKPDVVMEGGNAVVSGTFASICEDLSLLTTYHHPSTRLLTLTNATSAATASATNFLARLQGFFPNYWSETLRGLMIHSAEWTDEMIAQFNVDLSKKSHVKNLLKRCGYGVPNMNRATRCATNSLTLVVQREIQPFRQDHNKAAKINNVHIFDLPWPIDELRELGELKVRMRITLSYFISPNPGERGWKNRYRYQSYGLAFDINAPTENKDDFMQRINRAARDETYENSGVSNSQHWIIGVQTRNKGSIHSDIWEGTATELAQTHYIAVYPLGGWWKDYKSAGMAQATARYALLISIITPETPGRNIDIFLPVAIKTGVMVPITIETYAH